MVKIEMTFRLVIFQEGQEGFKLILGTLHQTPETSL